MVHTLHSEAHPSEVGMFLFWKPGGFFLSVLKKQQLYTEDSNSYVMGPRSRVVHPDTGLRLNHD